MIAGLLVLLLSVPAAHAVQIAHVIKDGAEVRQYPNASSPLVKKLPAGVAIKTSDKMVRDIKLEYWFKVRLEQGVGYIRVMDVSTAEEAKDMRGVGMSPPSAPAEPVTDSIASTSVRALGFLGFRSTTVNEFSLGIDLEATYIIPFEDRGYPRRALAVGPALVVGKGLTFIGASGVYRIFKQGSLAEPEARLRLGMETASSSFTLGLNIGIRYPFAPETSHYTAAYVELGSLLMVSTGIAAWGAAGIGYHF